MRIDEIKKALFPIAGSFTAQVDKEMTTLTASVHRDNRDLIFAYRSADRAKQLMAASKGRMKIVDDKTIYMRLKPEEPDDAEGLYKLLVRALKSNQA